MFLDDSIEFSHLKTRLLPLKLRDILTENYTNLYYSNAFIFKFIGEKK